MAIKHPGIGNALTLIYLRWANQQRTTLDDVILRGVKFVYQFEVLGIYHLYGHTVRCLAVGIRCRSYNAISTNLRGLKLVVGDILGHLLAVYRPHHLALVLGLA